MSKDISLNIDLSVNNKMSRYEIIICFFYSNWSFFDHGKFTYLPVGDEDWDWVTSSMPDEEILHLLQEKSQTNEIIGFSLTWEDTNIGGQILFFPNFKLSFCINNNIQIIKNNIVDVNWYLTKLLTVLDEKNIQYTSITYQEYR